MKIDELITMAMRVAIFQQSIKSFDLRTRGLNTYPSSHTLAWELVTKYVVVVRGVNSNF